MERRRRSRQHALLLVSAVMASLVAGSSAGIYHIVGAGKGWRMPPNKTYYEDWARNRHISLGDKLSTYGCQCRRRRPRSLIMFVA